MHARPLKIAAVVLAACIFVELAAYATLWCATDGFSVHSALPLSWFHNFYLALCVSAYTLIAVLSLLLLVSVFALLRRLFCPSRRCGAGP